MQAAQTDTISPEDQEAVGHSPSQAGPQQTPGPPILEQEEDAYMNDK